MCFSLFSSFSLFKLWIEIGFKWTSFVGKQNVTAEFRFEVNLSSFVCLTFTSALLFPNKCPRKTHFSNTAWIKALKEKSAKCPPKPISIHCAPSFCSFIQALIESNFLWDSSISTKTTDKPIWPYTLDYAIPHECKIKSCPTKVSRVVGFTRNIF